MVEVVRGHTRFPMYVDANVAAGMYMGYRCLLPRISSTAVIHSTRLVNSVLSFSCIGEGGDLSRMLQLRRGVYAAHSVLS